MAYSEFSLETAIDLLGVCTREAVLFPSLTPATVPDWLPGFLERGTRLALISEKARSEFIVAPILLAARELTGTASPDQHLRNELVVLARVLADASDNRDRWRRALEGLGAMKSAYLEEVRNEARKEASLNASRETKAAALLEVLRLRFPGQCPVETESLIRASCDRAALDRWFTAAVTATSADDFLRSIGL